MRPGSPLGLRAVPGAPKSSAVEELLMLTRIVGGANADENVQKMLTDLHEATVYNERVVVEAEELLKTLSGFDAREQEILTKEAALEEKEATFNQLVKEAMAISSKVAQI